ncbi:MAG: UDP-N-acetylglucosamine--LPS N-acetylglucosamine transferase [Clostridia bacterium]|nr:UDP-N-acetylglucosamine--LPS N-acetylglucosamine transferase [Clostridia bacterium]
MKKVLILTASTGGGHNQVAKTLEHLLDGEAEVRRVDFLKEESRIMDMIVAEGYDVLATKFPELYGRLYRLSNRGRKETKLNDLIRKMVHRRVREIIKDYEPDLIVGCHAFSIPIISALKRRGYYNHKFISIITDFEAHFGYISKKVDYYITGSDYTGLSLQAKGVDASKINCLGIPVSPVFYENRTPKLNHEPFTILVMGGSMGVDYMEDTVEALFQIKVPVRFIVVCGNNSHLEEKFKRRVESLPLDNPVEIHGFVNNIQELMDASDLIVTKPGGLTATESIVKNIPMVVPYYIPGQEEENLNYLTLANLAIAVRDINKIGTTIAFLINNKERLRQMHESMSYVSKNYSLEGVKALMLSAIEEE